MAEPKDLRGAVTDLGTALSLAGGIAFLATPERFMVGRVDPGGDLAGSDGAALALTEVFEARVCVPEAELRWLMTPEGGRAAVIAELDLAMPNDGWRRLDPLEAEPLARRYVVWGEGVADRGRLAPDWSRLSAARIGLLDLPVDGVGDGRRVEIEAVEYLVEHAHGNVAVDEERLVRLVAVQAQEAGGGAA
jgi:CRISPR-associated protein (TIGR03984 family)